MIRVDGLYAEPTHGPQCHSENRNFVARERRADELALATVINPMSLVIPSTKDLPTHSVKRIETIV